MVDLKYKFFSENFLFGFIVILAIFGMFMSSDANSADLFVFEYEDSYLDTMSIALQPGSERPYLFAGKGTSFFYGTTSIIAKEGWMGLHWGNTKLVHDFIITVDGKPLNRGQASVFYKPHEIVFVWDKGERLTIKPLGTHRDDLQFIFEGVSPHAQVGFFVAFPSGVAVERWKTKKPAGFQIFRLAVNEADTTGLAICSDQKFSVLEMRRTSASENNDIDRYLTGMNIHGAMFEAASFDVTLVYGSSRDNIGDRWYEIQKSNSGEALKRKQWMLDEINNSYFRCDDEDFTKAVNWAKVSLAQLLAEDEELIYAGFPWFNEGWGRDTFISFPGATLVTGKYEAAAKVIRRFTKWQDRDPESEDFGKVPNRARANDLIYNTADGTPWLIREIYEYGLYSGDTDLWKEMFDQGVIQAANNGTIKYRIDENGLLVHENADTWMDARGPEGAWSPRGNKAVDIQALWLTQLEASIFMAKHFNDEVVDAHELQEWKDTAELLRWVIPNRFKRFDGYGLYDHINADNSPDTQLRPNQLFAVTVPFKPIFTPEKEYEIAATVLTKMTYPYGVASLAQEDEEFHPYHHTWHYVQDAAYHNGIVWTWVSGPLKSALAKVPSRKKVKAANGSVFKKELKAVNNPAAAAWAITAHEAYQILNWGAPGTISENLDAVPREGDDPYTTGTISQAWSLAEFLRTIYHDYIGLHPDYLSASSDNWEINPRIPEAWGSFITRVNLNGQDVVLAWNPEKLKKNKDALIISSEKKNDKKLFIHLKKRRNNELKPGKKLKAGGLLNFQTALVKSNTGEIPFVKPEIRVNLKSLKGPDFPLLAPELVISDVSSSARVVHDIETPANDDTGDNGKYVYPKSPNFAPGILDITGVKIFTDDLHVWFTLTYRNLVDPGWHAEYGYQLTFTSIAINSGLAETPKTTDLERNSNFILPEKYAADRIIHVGGGFSIVDSEAKVMAKFIPTDAKYPLGNVSKKQIHFAVPSYYLPGKPEDWKISILVGGQDDHGGAGVGVFRAVSKNGGPWEGGGADAGMSNVYDKVFLPVE